MVSAPSLNSFKNRLDKCWGTQDIKFSDYRSDIVTGDVTSVREEETTESGTEEATRNPDPEINAR